MRNSIHSFIRAVNFIRFSDRQLLTVSVASSLQNDRVCVWCSTQKPDSTAALILTLSAHKAHIHSRSVMMSFAVPRYGLNDTAIGIFSGTRHND